MKLYQIAGKQYAVSGEDLYEKVPEFSPVQQITKSIDEEKSTSTFALSKKQIRNYVPKKGYKKGVCGKCGAEGHSAWHCPEKKQKKGFGVGSQPMSGRTCSNCLKKGHRSDHCPEPFHDRYFGGKDAQAKKRGPYKKRDELPPAEPGDDDYEEPVKREISKEMVDELRAEHPLWDTLKIAAELKCRLSDVNKFW